MVFRSVLVTLMRIRTFLKALLPFLALASVFVLAADLMIPNSFALSTKNISKDCRKDFNTWKKKGGYGAFAISASGSCGWNWDYSSLAEARADAVKGCRKYGSKCEVVAELKKPGAYVQRSDTCFKDSGEAGRIACEKIIAEDPKAAWAINNLGSYYEGAGNYEKALSFYKKAVALRDSNRGNAKLHKENLARVEALLETERRRLQELPNKSTKDICNLALDGSKTSWDSRAKYSAERQEAVKRGLTVPLCQQAVGYNVAPAQPPAIEAEAPQATSTQFDSRTKCTIVLNSTKTDWDRSTTLAYSVAEVQRRGLSVDDCREAIGLKKLAQDLGASTVGTTGAEPSETPNSAVCAAALAASRQFFKTAQAYAKQVAEARRLGLSVDDCRISLGLAPLNGDIVQSGAAPKPSTVSMAPKPMSLTEICERSLNAQRTDWSADPSASEARRQADAMGITVADCQLKLRTETGQSVATTVTSVPNESNEVVGGISTSASAKRKVALVIGNSGYRNAPILANPDNDAKAISSMLSGLGFEVISGFDLSNAETVAKVREFARATKSADVSLFFYAGHGLQIGGENYIVPVDAVVEDETAVSFELINISTITNFMGGLDKVGIVLLDACRDNPFSRSLKRSLSASRAASVNQGLAPISADGGGLFVAFSTAPGDVAADGEGMVNSPFTSALLRHLTDRGVEINTVMTRVKAEVAKMTKNDQRPWTNSDLTTEVYLSPVN